MAVNRLLVDSARSECNKGSMNLQKAMFWMLFKFVFASFWFPSHWSIHLGTTMSSKISISLAQSSSSRFETDFSSDTEKEDSPFPEVRASVSNIDNPAMPAMTVRMWFVGLVLCMASR